MPAPSLFWDQLLHFVEEGRVIPVVGPDLLRIEHEGDLVHLYPLLARRLAGYLQISAEGLASGAEFNEVAYRYLDRGGQIEDLYPALKDKFRRLSDSDEEPVGSDDSAD